MEPGNQAVPKTGESPKPEANESPVVTPAPAPESDAIEDEGEPLGANFA